MPGFNISGSGGGRIGTIGNPINTIETIRNYRWVIRTLGTITSNPRAGTRTKRVRTRGGKQGILARDVSLPNIEFETQEIMAGFIAYKFAKSMKVGPVSFSFYETFDTYKSLKEEWFGSVGDIESGIKAHDEYKNVVVIDLLNATGGIVYTITFNGAWPKSIELGSISYESTDIKLINMSCEFDYITEEFKDLDPESGEFTVEQTGTTATTARKELSKPYKQKDEQPAGWGRWAGDPGENDFPEPQRSTHSGEEPIER